MTTLTKSCIKWECTWKHKCALYFVPRANQYFAPETHSEHCHHFKARVVPGVTPEEDEAFTRMGAIE
jgi:hypothetical protein